MANPATAAVAPVAGPGMGGTARAVNPATAATAMAAAPIVAVVVARAGERHTAATETMIARTAVVPAGMDGPATGAIARMTVPTVVVAARVDVLMAKSARADARHTGAIVTDDPTAVAVGRRTVTIPHTGVSAMGTARAVVIDRSARATTVPGARGVRALAARAMTAANDSTLPMAPGAVVLGWYHARSVAQSRLLPRMSPDARSTMTCALSCGRCRKRTPTELPSTW